MGGVPSLPWKDVCLYDVNLTARKLWIIRSGPHHPSLDSPCLSEHWPSLEHQIQVPRAGCWPTCPLIADPGPAPNTAAPVPACWTEPAGQHYFSSLATATCPPTSPSNGAGASSSSGSSSSATSVPPRPAEGPLSARSRSNSTEHLLEAASGATEEPADATLGRARAVENQYSFY